MVTASCSEGLVLPLIPLSWALRCAGHDVLVVGPANMAPMIRGAGLPFAESAEPVEMPEMLSYDRSGKRVYWPESEEGVLGHTGRGYARLALRLYERAIEIGRKWRPDVILCETYSFFGPLAADHLGIPWVKHAIRLHSPETVTRAGAEELRPELAELGRTDFSTPLLSLDVCPPSLRKGSVRDIQEMRYVPYNGAETVPSWALEEHDRPRVCLTLGTRVPLRHTPIKGGYELLTTLMRRLTGLGFEVVVATSPAVAAEFGELPDGVRAAGYIPVSQVLPVCDLAVHHGGVGTTMACVTQGVPQVTIPVFVEIWESARLLAASGAARRVEFEGVEPSAVSPDDVIEAVEKIRADGSYQDRARLLKEEVATLPSPGDIARLIADKVAN